LNQNDTQRLYSDLIKQLNDTQKQYAVFYNRDRNAINSAIFKGHLEASHSKDVTKCPPVHTVIIKADLCWVQPNSKQGETKEQRQQRLAQNLKLPQSIAKVVYECCCDSNCKSVNNKSRGCDPFLCLYSGCKLMVNDNIAVEIGIANGTTCRFRKLKLKENADFSKISYDCYWVNAVDAADVECIILEHDDGPFKSKTFKISIQKGNYFTSWPEESFGFDAQTKKVLTISQFPVLVNNATTGHKSQGKTLSELVVNAWSNAKNWIYVVLSRVKTLNSLFINNPLPEDADFAPRENLLLMLERFRRLFSHEDVLLDSVKIS
jgi:hypothetical protein